MPNEYYVYALLDPRKKGKRYSYWLLNHEPFYVGYGKGNRLYKHFLKSKLKDNSKKSNKIRKIWREGYQVPVVVLRSKLNETDAKSLEIHLIRKIGRGKKGPLVNMTDGGEGLSGFVWKKSSRKRLALSMSTRYAQENNRAAHGELLRKLYREGKIIAPRGHDNGRSKLSPADLQEIRSSAESNRDLALRFRVSSKTISHARTGRTYGNNKIAPRKPGRPTKGSERKQRLALKFALNNPEYRVTDVARKFGVTRHFVNKARACGGIR